MEHERETGEETERTPKRPRLDTGESILTANRRESAAGTPITGILEADADSDLEGMPSRAIYGVTLENKLLGSELTDSASMHKVPRIPSRPSFSGIPGLFLLDDSEDVRIHDTDHSHDAESTAMGEQEVKPISPEKVKASPAMNNSNSEIVIEELAQSPPGSEGKPGDTVQWLSMKAANVGLRVQELQAVAEVETEDDMICRSSLSGHEAEMSKLGEQEPKKLGESEDPNAGNSDGEGAKVKEKTVLDPEFLAAAEANKGDENAEWQFDSSDEQDSDDSDSDSSGEEAGEGIDSDDEKAFDDYPGLSLEEQARILMEGEDDGDHARTGEPLRTKNEMPEESIKVEKPDITLMEYDFIEELGVVMSIVDATVLIKAKASGEFQVLKDGSVLTLENRQVIGAVSDLFGRVQEPIYLMRFNTTEEIDKAHLSVGTKIFYSPKHSEYVFTKAIKAIKGSDASNIHDEEVGEDEIEFSDDEAEAEYKRAKQAAKKSKAQDKGQDRIHERKSYSLAMPPLPAQDNTSDEPYKVLARPANLPELMANVTQTPAIREPESGSGFLGGNKGDRGRKVNYAGGIRSLRDGRGGNKGNKGSWEQKGEGRRESHGNRDGGMDAPQLGTSQNLSGCVQSQKHQLLFQQNAQLLQSTPHQQFSYNSTSYYPQTSPSQSPYGVPPSHPFAFQSQNFQFPSLPSFPPSLPSGAHVNPAFLRKQLQQVSPPISPQQLQGSYFYAQQFSPGSTQSTPLAQQSPQQPPFNWNYGAFQQQPQQLPQYSQQQEIASTNVSTPRENSSDAVFKAVQDQLDILRSLK